MNSNTQSKKLYYIRRTNKQKIEEILGSSVPEIKLSEHHLGDYYSLNQDELVKLQQNNIPLTPDEPLNGPYKFSNDDDNKYFEGLKKELGNQTS